MKTKLIRMDTNIDSPNALQIMDLIRDFSDKIDAELETSEGDNKEMVKLKTDNGCIVELVRDGNKDFLNIEVNNNEINLLVKDIFYIEFNEDEKMNNNIFLEYPEGYKQIDII